MQMWWFVFMRIQSMAHIGIFVLISRMVKVCRHVDWKRFGLCALTLVTSVTRLSRFFYINYIFFSRWPVRLRMNVMQKNPTKLNPMQYYNYWYFQRLFITLFSFQKKTEWKRDVSSVLCQFQQSKRRFLVVIMLIMLEVGSYMRCTFLVCAEESKVIKTIMVFELSKGWCVFFYFFWYCVTIICLFLDYGLICTFTFVMELHYLCFGGINPGHLFHSLNRVLQSMIRALGLISFGQKRVINFIQTFRVWMKWNVHHRNFKDFSFKKKKKKKRSVSVLFFTFSLVSLVCKLWIKFCHKKGIQLQ